MEHFAWPVAVLLCVVIFFLLFRSQIAGIITRINRFGFGNKSVEISNPTAAAQQQTKIEPNSGSDELPTVPISHAMPPSSEVHNPVEQEIKAALATANGPPELEKAWLIRALADIRIARGHEIAYRVIFGSQLELLMRANTASPPDIALAQEIYDKAKASHPELYADFKFDSWTNFPIRSGLIRTETIGSTVVFRITPLGQHFMHYLIHNSLTGPKYG